MTTQYYCPKCNRYFYEEELPNINMRHRRCGTFALVERFEEDNEKK